MPNQYTPGYSNQRSVVADFLAENPMSLTSDISKALDIDPRRVAHLLFVLKEEGRAVGVKMGTSKALSWRLSDGEQAMNEGNPIRIIVRQWNERPKRDPWTALFFGAAAA